VTFEASREIYCSFPLPMKIVVKKVYKNCGDKKPN
jgi:hypothetical protein